MTEFLLDWWPFLLVAAGYLADLFLYRRTPPPEA